MISEADANRLFDVLNRQHWRGRLPRYRVRFCMFRHRVDGHTYNLTQTILLLNGLGPRRLRRALLHEMCHIGPELWDAHGPRWLRKIERLIRRGETCLRDELQTYRTPRVRLLRAYLAAGRRDLFNRELKRSKAKRKK